MGGEEDQKSLVQQQNSSKASAPWENTNHPLFLHHSDQPGAVLVAQPLMEDNYTTWEQSMTMALTIKNKKGFIDGTLTKPTHNSSEQLQWERCNTLVKTWLLGAMSKEIASSVIHCKDARGMWLELKERFSQINTVALFQIESAIHGYEQGTTTITSFFTKLKSLWDEKDALCAFPPCSCEAATAVKDYIQKQKTMKFLMGLNEGFAQTRSNIIGMDPLPTLNKAYAMVLRQEKQAEASIGKNTQVSEASAFAVRKSSREVPFTGGDTKWCENCKMDNHNTKSCRAHLKCTYCGLKGHTYDYCRKRKKALAGEEGSSKANFVGMSNEGNEDLTGLPLSQSECKQMMSLLGKIKAAANKTNDGHQLLEMLNTTQPSSTNLVGNVPNFEEMSGPSLGEDDWDGS